MILEATETMNDRAGEGQQQFNWQTELTDEVGGWQLEVSSVQPES
jgi:hypothetical protein